MGEHDPNILNQLKSRFFCKFCKNSEGFRPNYSQCYDILVNNLQVNNLQVNNLQVNNLQVNNLQVNNLQILLILVNTIRFLQVTDTESLIAGLP